MTPDALRTLLREVRTIAVVGLSPRPERPSHAVARYLRRAGYRIVPVNPHHARVLDEPSYPTLAAAAAAHAIDMVDVFRKSEAAGAVVDEAVALQPAPRLIWLQLGVVDATAGARAAVAGILCVMDRCLAVAHHDLGL